MGVLAPSTLLVLLVAASCGGDDDRRPDAATLTVTYRYQDASVPPEYHRSYDVIVGDGEARVVVDSYGDVLHDVTELVDVCDDDEATARAERIADAIEPITDLFDMDELLADG